MKKRIWRKFNNEYNRIDKLQAENKALKKELDEKDKYIKNLENNWKSVVCNNYNLQQTQLYKEDLEREQLVSYEGQLFYKGSIKKEIYDKLPSKDVK